MPKGEREKGEKRITKPLTCEQEYSGETSSILASWGSSGSSDILCPRSVISPSSSRAPR